MTQALIVAALTLAALAPSAVAPPSEQAPPRRPDVIFVPTSDAVADAMLALAQVGPKDVLYDLGCGDGKLVITAARRFGTRGVGIDIDPQRIREANANAEAAGVADKVRFIQGDIFDPAVTFSDATVVTLYLLTELNVKLRPRLLNELAPGTRIVSNSFSMGDWAAERVQQVGNFTIYFWTIPARR
jgi:SAM-dependent methyltransferase